MQKMIILKEIFILRFLKNIRSLFLVFKQNFFNFLLYLYNFFYFKIFVCLGLGGGMVFAPAYIVVGQYFDRHKGKAMGISTLGTGLGSVALAPIIVYLLETYTLQGALLLFGAFELHSCISAALYRPVEMNYQKPKRKITTQEAVDKAPCQLTQGGAVSHEMQVMNTDEKNSELPVDETEMQLEEDSKKAPTAKIEPAKEKFQILSYFKVVTNWKFMLYGWQITCMASCSMAYFIFLPAFAVELGTDKYYASLLLSILGASDMLGRFAFSFLFDLKIIRENIGRRNFHSAIGILMGLFSGLTGFMNIYLTIAITSVMWGLVEGIFHGQRTTVITEFVPKHQMSSATGFVLLFQGVGSLIGPIVAGKYRVFSNNNCNPC